MYLILYKPYKFKLGWDKESKTRDLSIVTVCNGGYYGGGFHVNPSGIYNDGMLDAYIVYATNRRQIIKYLVQLLRGKHETSDLVEHVRSDNFTITTETPIEANLDGESMTTTKFEMRVIPKALTFYHNEELLKGISKKLGKKG